MSKQTGDLSYIKRMNKSIVLDAVRARAPISRAALATETGLTKATVSSLVQELIVSDLVREIGVGKSSGGRKPMMLVFHAAAGYAIGVDLAANYVRTVLTDLEGQIVAEAREEHTAREVAEVVDVLYEAISRIKEAAPASTYGIVGVGIGIPGIVDEQGHVLFAPHLEWRDVPLADLIGERLDMPVVIENEANAGAAGERRYGAGQHARHLLYISVGMGIGAGMIMNGELYRGTSGFAGEVGHMSIMHDGHSCSCGSLGCWELFASEQALLEQARGMWEQRADRGRVSVGRILGFAEQGDAEAIWLLEQQGHFLGRGVVNLVNVFNPELILVGGRLAEAEQWLMQPMVRTFEQRSLPYPRRQLSIQFARLGSRSTMLGASSLAIERFWQGIHAIHV